MKKKGIILLLAIFVGGMLAFFTLTKMNLRKSDMDTITLTVLQTGVFSKLENALEQQKALNQGVIYQHDGYYLVLVGASMNEAGLTKIENALQKDHIHYYKKELTILEKDKDLFFKYNALLEKASNEETVLLLNQKILEKMSEV